MNRLMKKERQLTEKAIKENRDGGYVSVTLTVAEAQGLLDTIDALESEMTLNQAAFAREVTDYIDTVTGPTGGWLVSPKEAGDHIRAAAGAPEDGK